MTTKPVKPQATNFVRLPDARPCDMGASTFHYVTYPGYPAALFIHFGSVETTVISSAMGASVRPTESYEEVRFPDLLVALGGSRAAHFARNGYVIEEQGKPPDFVLEVASPSNARSDETVKKDFYACMGVVEYWRFDHTGGELYRSGLEGDTLVDGRYQAILINRTEDGQPWGHSTALGLDLCWEEGRLRWRDPVDQRYLMTYHELARDLAAMRQARIEEEEREARLAEREARLASEARTRELEAKLRRRDQA